jgi:hypothetical protein
MVRKLLFMFVVLGLCSAANAMYLAPGSLTATASTAASAWGAYGADAGCDQFDMDMGTLIHECDSSTYWHSFASPSGVVSPTGANPDQWYMVEFDGEYELINMLVYNSAMNVDNRALKDVVISYTVDGLNWTPIATNQLSDISGIDCCGRTYSDDVPFGTVAATGVCIDMYSAWYGESYGDPDGYYMMDDVLFNVVPEPATLSLLGLGALTLIRRKR